MAPEITLQDLIEKIKTDLFSPYKSESIGKNIIYPIFLVDQVEVELNLSIGYEAGAGIKLSIPQLAEASLNGKGTDNTIHKMKVVLRPILSADRMRELISTDQHLMEGITKASVAALKKGANLAGEEE